VFPPAGPAEAIRKPCAAGRGTIATCPQKMLLLRLFCAVAEVAKKNSSMGHVPPLSPQSPCRRIVRQPPRVLCAADIRSISRRGQPPLGLPKLPLEANNFSYLSG
jgi:hypothetical protein